MSIKILILVRHGEAETFAPSDRLRTLTALGKDQASRVGRTLAAKLPAGATAVVSPARRTVETSEMISRHYETSRVIQEPALYTARSLQEFRQAVSNHLRDHDVVAVVIGHNPIISTTASDLSGESIHFSPGEFLALNIESDDWPSAMEMSGCWQKINLETSERIRG